MTIKKAKTYKTKSGYTFKTSRPFSEISEQAYKKGLKPEIHPLEVFEAAFGKDPESELQKEKIGMVDLTDQRQVNTANVIFEAAKVLLNELKKILGQ